MIPNRDPEVCWYLDVSLTDSTTALQHPQRTLTVWFLDEGTIMPVLKHRIYLALLPSTQRSIQIHARGMLRFVEADFLRSSPSP